MSPRHPFARLSVALACSLAVGATPAEETAHRLGTLGDPGLREASGLAASLSREDLLWALNDSGNQPDLYALGLDGRRLGTVRVAGARNRDWEDLAAFRHEGAAYLLIADTGDNGARRTSYQLYAVREPELADGRMPRSIPVSWQIEFSYPDGSMDCEAVGVDPLEARVLLLSKRTKPPRLYTVELESPADAGRRIAQPLGELTTLPSAHRAALGASRVLGRYASQPTALDFASDGSVAVLTYAGVYLYSRRDGPLTRTFASAPRLLGAPRLAQPEALTFLADDALVITSEGRAAPLLRLDLR